MSIRLGIGIDNFASGGIDADATTIYNRIIADGGVSNLTRLNFFVKGLKTIYGSLTNVPVCYDAHWIGYKLGSGTGATAGQAAAKLYSLTIAGDAVQTTAASQPLLLLHNGVDNYAWFPKVTGNYINSTTTYATNNIDFEISISTPSSSTGNQQIIGGNDTTPISIQLNRTAGTIFIEYYVGGYKSCSAPFTREATNIIRVTRNSATGAITIVNNGTTLTTSGSQTAGTFDSSLNSLCVGGFTGGYPFEGKINYINCYISGVLTRTFNPNTYNASTSQTQWTSATGEIWTISTASADTGLAGKLVDRTVVIGNGTTFTMNAPSPSFTRKQLTWLVAANQTNATNATFLKINKTTDTNSGVIRVLTATTMQNTTSDGFSLLGGSTVDGVSTVSIVRNKLHVIKGLNSLMDGGTVPNIGLFDDTPNNRFIRGIVNTVIHTSNTNDISSFLRTLNNL